MPPLRGYRWLTPELLAAARKLGNVGRVHLARGLGVTHHQAQILLEVLRGQTRLEEPEKPEVSAPPRPAGPPGVLKYLNQARTVEELADLLNCPPREVRTQLDQVGDSGYPLESEKNTYWLDKNPAPAEAHVELQVPDSNTVRFGFVSDSHLGSTRQQLTYLTQDYQRFADAGITTVLHMGDMLAGVNVYRGQAHDLFLHTYQAQEDYAAEKYPRIPGITTMAISGNHDLAGLKGNGTDPFRRIATERPDIKYLGAYSAWLTLGPLRVYMLHPDGGQSYAKSWKLQKLAESFPGGEKPHVAFCGHWHSRTYLDERNIHLFHAGCYEAQTDFERRHLLSPVIGGGIVEIEIEEENGFHALTPKFFKHFVPKEMDF